MTGLRQPTVKQSKHACYILRISFAMPEARHVVAHEEIATPADGTIVMEKYSQIIASYSSDCARSTG